MLTDIIKEYCQSINIAENTEKRIHEIKEIYQSLDPQFESSIEDVFVTNMKSAEGTYSFSNLWFFSKNYVYEAKNFIHSIDIDKTRIDQEHNLYYWNITLPDGNWGNIDDHIVIRGNTGNNMGILLTGVGENKKHLLRIIKKYLNCNIC